MKKIIAIIMLGLAGAFSATSHAANADRTFDVNITLASVCQITSVPTAAFTYTSFQTTPATFESSFNILCTNTLPIAGIALDSEQVTDASTNLAYKLELGAVPSAGTGVAQNVKISGEMAAGQAGTCATASCSNTASTNKQRTLTITY